MAGAYCNYCGQRCFVYRVIPDGPSKGWAGHLATCHGGMAHDLKVTGYTHLTAVNPVTDPGAAAAIGPQREYAPVDGQAHQHNYAGQTLRHAHPGGDQEHGYFEHPEDVRS